MLKCTLLGSSGLVGAACLRELSAREEIAEIICPVRNPENTETLPKAKIIPINFQNLKAHRECFETDAVICCLGSTRKKAGNAKERDLVDLHLPLTAAAIAKDCGVKHFLVVSAQGANSKSWIPYNRAKGLLEEGLEILQFPSLTIARPSLLLGKRKEKRFFEDLAAKMFTKVPPPVFWRPVAADAVARALVESVLQPPGKKRILFNRLLGLF
ncbi:MAG: NAD(P)H-binding protein [Fibrobacteraceae bacterium]|nr:NAD(P)H-binding protein [Fibrobacteraceae bacterium]